MKRIFLLFGATCSLVASAQEFKDTAYFQDGTVIPFYLYNLNDHPPKFNTIVAPFTAFIADGPAFAFTLEELYRLNDRIILDGRITSTYGKTDEGVNKNIDGQKPFLDLMATFNYRFARIERMKKRHVNLQAKSSMKPGVDYELYQFHFDAENYTNFYLTGGLAFTRTSGSFQMPFTDSSYFDYTLGNMKSLSVTGGITRERYHYFIYGSTALNKPKYYYYKVRNYLLFSYAASANYDVYAYRVDPQSTEATPYEKVRTGFTTPDVQKLGWRFGAEVKMAMSGAHNSPFIGIEFGQLPRASVAGSTQGKYNAGFLTFRLGAEFGTRTRYSDIKK